MGAPRKLTPEQEAEAVTLYESGLSILKVGEKFGMGAPGMRVVLLRNGATIRPTGDQSHRDVPTERILQLRRQRYSYGQIGRILGMSPSSVRARVKRAEAKKK